MVMGVMDRGLRKVMLAWMPLDSLRCRSTRFDNERLNQKVKITTLKKNGPEEAGQYFHVRPPIGLR